MEFSTLEEVMLTLQQHEVDKGVRFVSYASSKNFGLSDVYGLKKVYFTDHPSVRNGRISNSDVPFAVLGHKRLDCQFGKLRKKKSKTADKICEDHDSYTRGKKFLVTTSRKLGCEAACYIRELCRFPTYKTSLETSIPQRLVCDEILARIRGGEEIPFERFFILCLPHDSEHAGHPFGEPGFISEDIDRKVSDRIRVLVGDGITSASIMRTDLNRHIKEVLKVKPHPACQRFYPSLKSIRNVMYQHCPDLISNDQDRLKTWIENELKERNSFIYCRLKSDHNEKVNEQIEFGENFLFLYQSTNQRRLLERYGSTVFLDATYKTTTYELSLFFLVVKTNVDYQVVGLFVVENERSTTIAEALSIFRKHCCPQNIPFFMVDFDESEINAIETVFPESKVVICDFHRNQAWERWASKKENSGDQKDAILRGLYRLARAGTTNEFIEIFDEIKETEIWTNPRF